MFLVVRDRMHRHVPALRVVGEHIQRWNFVIEYVEDTGHTLHEVSVQLIAKHTAPPDPGQRQ
ncbi:uncharacterized protein LOC105737390 isoform X2 [Apis florea]|uniref:uncharacterized protein LOC105737390 isoform X2 n=1 Tax=Apis florea TaxID=7463 RepID=UPI00062964B4|nr:uncharacterized protein LOC105737390 isoform X2 [Apis florea]